METHLALIYYCRLLFSLCHILTPDTSKQIMMRPACKLAHKKHKNLTFSNLKHPRVCGELVLNKC